MKFTNENSTLTLYFEGELNSYNAESIDKDIEQTLANQKFMKLVLDFARLVYISSAGLRVILKLKQKYQDVTVVEVSLEVYDIFSMTGFTNIMEIKKGLKKIDLTGAEIIGDGYFSTVYRIDKDTIIKVFNKTSDIGQIERELKLAKLAFVLGIPTAISFDIVKVNDDKLGVRFEMLDCMSLQSVFIKRERLDEYVDKYASLLKKMNTTESLDPTIPDMKANFLTKYQRLEQWLPKDRYEQIKKMLEAIPNRQTLIHGDCHFKNIFVQKDELLLIDMDTLSIGYPIFELAALHFAYVALNEDEADNSMKFFKISREEAYELYDGLIDRYFGKDNQAVKDKIAMISYIHVLFWNRKNELNNQARFESVRDRLYKLLDQYQDFDIGV